MSHSSAVAAPSSRFVEWRFKRHGWKPCPTRSCRRARVIDGTSGFKILCGMALGCRGEWTLLSRRALLRRHCQMALQTARLEAMPSCSSLFLAGLARSVGLREVGLGMTGWEWKCGAEALLPRGCGSHPSQNRGRMGQSCVG
jgi:hypothetical protein